MNLSPQNGDEESLAPSDFEGVYQRMLSLEQELVEFQESSKELEQALEEELRTLESQNAKLVAQVQAKDAKIVEFSERVVGLNSEISALQEEMLEASETHKKEVQELKGKLVNIEILNDDMISHDRVLESKLQLSNQFNNELLEKLAIVENDLELEKQENAKHRLTISNLENTASTRRHSRRFPSTNEDEVTLADGTILDIGEMLASEPAKSSDGRIPKSGSLSKMQSLFVKSEVLRQKVGVMNTTLASYTDETGKRHSRLLEQRMSSEKKHDEHGKHEEEEDLKKPVEKTTHSEKSGQPRIDPLAAPMPIGERSSSLPAEVQSLPAGSLASRSTSTRRKARAPPQKKQSFRTSVRKLFS